MTEVGSSLGAKLEAALLRQLVAAFDGINEHHFGGKLRRPVIALDDAETRWGAWHGDTRALTLARRLVLQHPWGVVQEVLKHEMAHQFVDEVLGVRDEPAHGPSFESLCGKLGIDADASGLPQAGFDGGAASPVLRRIAKLLALADSPNQHEAELAMRQAQRLMLAHNIDEAAASARAGFSFRHLGTPRQRIDAHEHVLGSLIGRHFFVSCIWVPSYDPHKGRSGRVLEICGTLSNLDVASYVHGFLLETGERLWRAHKRDHRVPGDRERRRFLLGVMMGFEDKLTAGAADNRREGLVWLGDPAVRAYMERRHPRRSSGGSIGFQQTAAYHQGRAAGQSIVLHKPVGSGPSSGSARGLLK